MPPLENMLRAVLKLACHNTQHIDTKGIPTEKSSSALVDQSFAEEVLGEDRAFDPKSPFCDPIGPNPRSKVTLNYFLIRNGENDEKAVFSASNAHQR